jgi:type VI secretion system protein ImpJ
MERKPENRIMIGVLALMKRLSPVVWEEGMHLAPHHFQAQSRYFEDLVDFTADCVSYSPHGLISLEIDEEALQNGALSLKSARGILPDGMIFEIPESDERPDERSIADVFPATQGTLMVYLAVTPYSLGSANCSLEESPAEATRFVAVKRTLVDEATGLDEREVRFGRKNLQMVLETEEIGDRVRMPLARIRRDPAGRFVVDLAYAPPSLQISSAQGLTVKLRSLLQLLEEKSAAMRMAKAPEAGAASGFSAEQITNSWLLHSINSGIASLRHLCFTKHTHPEEIFAELSRLGGALCTFSLRAHPKDLPVYDHEDLVGCYDRLIRHIRDHLDAIVATNVVQIPLRQANEFFHAGQVADERLLEGAHWILGVASSAGEGFVTSRAPTLIKVCSWDFIEKLVQRAVPGMSLTHMPSPPAAISPKLEMQYFRLQLAGPCWDHIRETRRIGIYTPGDLTDCRIELTAVMSRGDA